MRRSLSLLLSASKSYILATLLIVGLIAGSAFAANPFAGKTDDEILAQIDSAVASKKASKDFGAALAALLDDADANIRTRERAAWAIGQLEIASGVPSLTKAAEHKGLLIRSAALGSLERIRPLSALPVIVNAALADPILQIRQRATISLGLFHTDKAIDPVVRLSTDAVPEIRGASALAMAMLHSKKNDFSEVLQEMVKDDNPYVKERAERAIDIIKGKMLGVMELLDGGDPDVRLAAAAHLERTAGKGELKGLQDAWNAESDDDVRKQLERTIVATKKRVKEEEERLAAQKAATEAKGHTPGGVKKAPVTKPFAGSPVSDKALKRKAKKAEKDKASTKTPKQVLDGQ